MIDLSPEIITIMMLGGVLVGVLIGYPLAIPVGALGLIFGFLLFGTPVFDLLYARLFKLINSYALLAVPLFVFMGVMLERSGIAERMYDALYLWLSGLRGGLAIITVLMGTVLAACVGIIGASVSMLALLALPSMVKRGYSKSLASGAVCAGGTLGILIPPVSCWLFTGQWLISRWGSCLWPHSSPVLCSPLYTAFTLPFDVSFNQV